MKISSFLFLLPLLFGLIVQSYGQTDSLSMEEQKEKISFKGYIGGVFERAPVAPGNTNSFGLQGAVFIKNHIQLGAYGVNYSNNNYRERLIFPNAFQMNYKHGGVLLGYRTLGERDYEFNLESKIGFGEVKWDELESGNPFLADKFLMFHIQGGVDYLLANFVALNAYLGYRRMTGLEITGLSNDDFTGLYYGVVLKLGILR